MEQLQTPSFLWVLIVATVITIIYGIRAFLAYRTISKDAQEDYDYTVENKRVGHALSRDDYVKTYIRAHAPRHLVYMASAMAAVVLLTYPILVVIQLLLHYLWIFNDRSDVFEPGFLVWKFMIFFSLVATWAAIIYFTARRYHVRAPMRFDLELAKHIQESHSP